MNAVGIDVSKEKSTVTIRQPGDVVVLAPRDYRHTQSSINDLIATIKGLVGETKVCMEHTGRYYHYNEQMQKDIRDDKIVAGDEGCCQGKTHTDIDNINGYVWRTSCPGSTSRKSTKKI